MRVLKSKILHVILGFFDIALVVAAFVLGVYLRFDLNVPAFWLSRMNSILLPAAIIHIFIFYLFGLYRRVWRYTGINDLFLISAAVSVGTFSTFIFSTFFEPIPRSSYIIAWFLLILFISGIRLALRVLLDYLSRPKSKGKKKKALIIGAGEAGVLVARELKRHSSNLLIKVIGFIDDDPAKQNQIIHGLPVLGNRKMISEVVDKKQIDEVVIAMPSAPYSVLQEVVVLCEGLDLKIKTVPGIYEILDGNIKFNTLKEVGIEDLLRRPPVKLDLLSIAAYLSGLTVLVSGAGGSIGSELCRQIAKLGPEKLILVDHDENAIFYINNELRQNIPRVDYYPLVCDVKDYHALETIIRQHRPSVIFHAAAHKHVPLMEINVEEAVRNNIMGSKNIIDLAEKHAVKKFVFISTDKAVNPSSVMGATKRVVEIYLQKKAKDCNKCVFSSVRFGNVLGSQGSVVLLFKEQIARGGPVTVTHPDMKRYFMTIPEAVQLVIQAGAMCKGGEIFVLDMGEPVNIVDMARDMIILSGLKPEKDIKIEYSGLRPGEKLYEELFSERENFALTRHERIYIAPDSYWSDNMICKELEELGKKLGLGNGLVNIVMSQGNGHLNTVNSDSIIFIDNLKNRSE